MKYIVAEKFKSPQGEGVYAGTPMAFIRFVGCSVGKRICQHCDTDFDHPLLWRGGGEFTTEELLEWIGDYEHVCLTGGEPLDQYLAPLTRSPHMFHIETSGTKRLNLVTMNTERPLWVCVSPKPGFLEDMVMRADEVKVIVPGLGEITDALAIKLGKYEDIPLHNEPVGFRRIINASFRWPDLNDALRWARMGKIVFLQPRNGKFDIDQQNLRYVLDLLVLYPQLRVSTQMHKILKVQ